MGAAQLNAILNDTVDRHYCRPAVMCGHHETDFERFDESVQWLSDDLAARGVQSRQRVGICLDGGWEFLLAFHALVRLDTVVVPIDPFDEASAVAAGDLDLHFIVSHRGEDCLLEETVEAMCGNEACPMFDVSDEFTLVAVSEQSPLRIEAGLLLDDVVGYRFWPAAEVADRIDGLREDLDLDTGACAAICGPFSCPSVVFLVLACAASGSCVQVVPSFGDSGTAWDEMAAGEASVVFAPPLLMHDFVRVADSAAWGSSRPRMVLPDGEVLPEVILRRRGLRRQPHTDRPVYEFGWTNGYVRRSAQLRPVS
ncbi:AMP-binding protein [Williamsia sp. 1135]|uniref:AMP-binding protein n=1 Tax=Williamsia sp. 1135 TaxID=1889262 RepID=UPI00143BE93A|nr:AMP-binding protein [Williamsia sp. 1135]